MEVLVLLIFVSLVLVASAVGFFAWNVRQQAHDHVDRLSLLPLDESERSVVSPNPEAVKES